MIIKNPLEKKVSIQIRGQKYEIDGLGTKINVPKDIAEHWKSIHEFLIVSDSTEPIEVEKPVLVETPVSPSTEETGGQEIPETEESTE